MEELRIEITDTQTPKEEPLDDESRGFFITYEIDYQVPMGTGIGDAL